MCCFSVADVFLEDPPPEKKKEEDKVKKNCVLVSDQLNLQPIVSRPVAAFLQLKFFSLHFISLDHIVHHNILSSSTQTDKLNIVVSVLHTETFRNAVRRELQPPSRRKSNALPAGRPHQSMDKSSAFNSILPAVGCVESLDKPSSYCVLCQHELPPRSSTSLLQPRRAASGGKPLDKPSCPLSVILIFKQLEPSPSLQSIFC